MFEYYAVLSSLGQACYYIAALLIYIECHLNDAKLPTNKSKTSLGMTWNQPPKKIDQPVPIL